VVNDVQQPVRIRHIYNANTLAEAAAVRAMYTTPKKNRKFAQVVSAGTASCRKRHNTVKKCDKDADEVVWCTVKT